MSNSVNIEVNGIQHIASYNIDGNIVTVNSLDYGSKSTQLGGSTAELLAKLMLRELIVNE